MKSQIVHISKLQTAKVMAVLYVFLSIPLVLLTTLPYWMEGQPVQWIMLVLFPLGYGVFGFVFTFVGAWIYNGVAGRIGGIEFVAEQVESVGSESN